MFPVLHKSFFFLANHQQCLMGQRQASTSSICYLYAHCPFFTKDLHIQLIPLLQPHSHKETLERKIKQPTLNVTPAEEKENKIKAHTNSDIGDIDLLRRSSLLIMLLKWFFTVWIYEEPTPGEEPLYLEAPSLHT